jgi:hypothetical protein
MKWLLVVFIFIVMIYVALQTNKEHFWYYPNCMETAFGGKRCYPNYYPNRFYYPLFPWFYSDDYYYPYTTAPY